MHILKKTLTTVLFFTPLSFADECKNEDVKFKRHIHFDSGLIPGNMSPRAIMSFTHDVHRMTGIIFDFGDKWLEPNKWWTRAAYQYVIYPMFVGRFANAFYQAMNNFGRASRYEAFGLDVNYVDKTYSTKATGYWKTLGVHLFKSLNPVSINHYMEVLPSEQKFKHPDALSTNGNIALFKQNQNELEDLYEKKKAQESVDLSKTYLDSDVAEKLKNIRVQLSARLQILTRAGEYNTQMAYSNLIETEMWYDDGGHLRQTTHYGTGKLALFLDGMKTLFFNKHSAARHTDMAAVSDLYDQKSIDLSCKTMMVHSAIAYCLSSQFWYGFTKPGYLSSGSKFVHTPSYKGFRLPNLGFYLTSDGPSYQLTTGYKWDEDMWFPLSAEYVFLGNKKSLEIKIGARKKFASMKNLYLHAEVLKNFSKGGWGAIAYVGIQPTSLISIEVGVQRDDINTLDGERNIISLKNGNSYTTLWGKIGLNL